jgi:nucleotide-binding universal stress UspA family protein
VLDSRLLEGPLMADISGWIGAQPYGQQLQQFREVLEMKGQAIVDALVARVDAEGLKLEPALRMGHPSRMILEEEAKHSLVILGESGIHADLVGDSLGSTAERVIRHATRPCLVTPANFRMPTKIMAAYDGSDFAKHAVELASVWATALDAALILLTIAEEKDMEKAQTLSEEAIALAGDPGKSAVTLVGDNPNPSAGILENAAEQGADLIVMGAYGQRRLREMILGSVTTQVVVQADIPVLLVR